jgi:TIR domain
MRIFLSYATEDKAIAEPIAFSLRARDHEVFLDRDDLPAAGDYNKRIELALDQADFMVFLLSPTSIAKGRYTLTELEFARRKWRTADGRVLPVIVQPTPLNDIPSFLKSVTILEPKGNTAAEVASAVDRVQPISRGAARANAGLEFIATYCTTGALLLSSVVISYFLTFFTALTPPIKPALAVFAMSTLVACHAILRATQVGKRKPPLGLMLVAMTLYLVLFFGLTFRIPTSLSGFRDAVGFVCTKDYVEIYKTGCPPWVGENVLANASHEPDKIWESWSVGVVKAGLAAIWLALVWLTATTIALSATTVALSIRR